MAEQGALHTLGSLHGQCLRIVPLRCFVLQNDSLATLLARLEGILGPLPQHMVRKGRFSHRFYTRQGVIYERSQRTVSASQAVVHAVPHLSFVQTLANAGCLSAINTHAVVKSFTQLVWLDTPVFI